MTYHRNTNHTRLKSFSVIADGGVWVCAIRCLHHSDTMMASEENPMGWVTISEDWLCQRFYPGAIREGIRYADLSLPIRERLGVHTAETYTEELPF